MVMPFFIFITAGPTNLGFEGDWAVLGIINTQNKKVVLSESLSSTCWRGMTEDAGGGCKETTKSSTHKAAEQLSLWALGKVEAWGRENLNSLVQSSSEWCDLAAPACLRLNLISAGDRSIREEAHGVEKWCVRHRGGDKGEEESWSHEPHFTQMILGEMHSVEC